MDRLTLAGVPLRHFHVCAFFNSRDEEYATLAPFFREAIDEGEKNLHIVNPEKLQDHRNRLAAEGIDVAKCESCGQLELLTWSQAYLSDNNIFNKDQMLQTVQQMSTIAHDAGYKRLRIMGNMDWIFTGFEEMPDLIAYEAEVNEILTRNRQPAICVYDLTKISAPVMLDLLRTHPLTLIGDVLKENPFYLPPSQMLQEIRAQQNQESAGE
jgi:hypothetical protein